MTDDTQFPVLRKYSKSSDFYLNIKKDYFSENDALLNRASRQNALYAAQPRRTLCKLCRQRLPATIDFNSHGVDYTFCTSCSHLNGNFEDTKSFVEQLYIADSGRDYSGNYIDQNFLARTQDIYVPKVDFLLQNLAPGPHEVLDVGCGSGYFVYAALLRDLSATGIDVGCSMVDFGNGQISHLAGKSPLRTVDEDAFYQSILTSQADVISVIGVIEHLRDPHEFFDAFARGASRYIFYSVPMFSFSVILENLFKEVFPRQLSGGHTHLYTEQSIQAMNALLGVRPIAEWRFGTDVMDLYRSSITMLRKHNVSDGLTERLQQGFVATIDTMQSVLDQGHFCSEIHCLARKCT